MIGMKRKKCWNAGIKVKRDDLDGRMIGMNKKRWDEKKGMAG